MAPFPVAPTRSLYWRFMAAFGGLLALVVGVFSIAAYQAEREGAVEAASARLEAVTAQVAGLLANGLNTFVVSRAPMARDERLLRLVADPASDPSPARPLLDSLGAEPSELRGVTLHASDGEMLIGAGRDPDLAPPPFPTGGSSVPVTGFRMYDGSLGYGVMFAVADTATSPARGWLVYHIDLGTTPESVGRIMNLIGDGARLMVGTPGGLWTDLLTDVPSPPDEMADQVAATFYEAADGESVLSAGAPVLGTPWLVHIEFPQSAVVSSARSLMTRLLPFGLLVLAGGLFAGWRLTRGVTRRLDTVMAAAGTIAAGDYHGRVPVEGDDELTALARSFNRMADQVEVTHDNLEAQVARRTAELEAANQELEAFSYSVSHDLRAPLRAVHGFSRAVLEDHGSALPERGRDDLDRVCAAAERMGDLIDDLLDLSRATRAEMHQETLPLSAMAHEIVDELRRSEPDRGRDVEVRIEDSLTATGDRALVRLVLRNLLENAWKFTRHREGARIEVARADVDDGFVVRDNGAGFDAEFAHKLFQPFQRLHTSEEFEGTGVGLALSSRIIHRHGGQLWAEGSEGEGAAFYFTLPGVST